MDSLLRNKLLLHLFMGVFLTSIYPLQELFSGNQNIYFLWGMAELLPDAFQVDPLLNSPDPYPLFSWVISLVPVQILQLWTVLIYVLLNSVYTYALFGIADVVGKIYQSPSRFLAYASLFLLLHCNPIWGTYFGITTGVDLRWMWDSGIAEQGVLRGYFQPSVFGVFLLLSFYFGSRRKHVLAILTIAPAACVHANYLFLGGILTLVYLTQAKFERKTLLSSLLLLVLVSPYLYYILQNFLSIDEPIKTAIEEAVMLGYAQNIHINPENWISEKFFIQLGILFFGLMISWQAKLRYLFSITLAVSFLVTLFAYATENVQLISLNPWRFSILLVPISSALILAKLTSSSYWKEARGTFLLLSIGMCVSLVYYRLFGNSSSEFAQKWNVLNGIALLGIPLLVGWILSKKQVLLNLLPPTLLFSLMVTGVVDR